MTWVLARASLRYVVFLTCDLGLINTCRSLLWSFENIDISIQFCRVISNYMPEWPPAHHFFHVVLIPEHARGPGHALYVPNASRRDNLSRHRGPLIAPPRARSHPLPPRQPAMFRARKTAALAALLALAPWARDAAAQITNEGVCLSSFSYVSTPPAHAKPNEPKKPTIVDLMQELMNQLCPTRMYNLDPTERFVAIVRTYLTVITVNHGPPLT